MYFCRIDSQANATIPNLRVYIDLFFDDVIEEINKYSEIDHATVLVQGKFYLLAGAV